MAKVVKVDWGDSLGTAILYVELFVTPQVNRHFCAMPFICAVISWYLEHQILFFSA
jgi:hypothetical protein